MGFQLQNSVNDCFTVWLNFPNNQ